MGSGVCMNLGELMCGVPNENMYDLNKIMGTLGTRINTLLNKIAEYDWEKEESPIEVLFYARNILESSLTALVGRFDPFRLIMVYKVQSSTDYDIGKRSKSAVEWGVDIIAKQPVSKLNWDPEFGKEKFDRALLGDYCGDIIWKPAFTALFDYLENQEIPSIWIEDILSKDDNGNFQSCKSEARELFSAFSKGVHSESLVDETTILDETTVKDLVRRLLKLCSTLGLISHFIGYLVPNTSIENAMTIFLNMEEKMNEL